MKTERFEKEKNDMLPEKEQKEFESLDEILDYIEESSDDLIVNIRPKESA